MRLAGLDVGGMEPPGQPPFHRRSAGIGPFDALVNLDTAALTDPRFSR